MLYLDSNSTKIKKAKKNHKDKLNLLLRNRISNVKNASGRCFLDLVILPKLNDLLVGDPSELQRLNDLYNPRITNDINVKESVEYVFNYDDWFVKKTISRYSAYHLANSLDINTCVYCNRNYTNTVITNEGEKIIRPEFDHYFDKGKNPLLALSFFNLIPSCHICNSNVKHSATFKLDSHIHPYVDNKIDEVLFSYKFDLNSKDGLKIKVSADDCERTQKTIEEFAIEEIYNSHTDIVYDLLKTRQAFSERYLEILSNDLLKDIVISDDELYRLVFGTELKSDNFVNRPMSKFKSDILKELGIIT